MNPVKAGSFLKGKDIAQGFPSRIIVVMKNWLGDLLFQMPALDMIHQK